MIPSVEQQFRLPAHVPIAENQAEQPVLSWAERAVQHAVDHPTGKLLELAFDEHGLHWNTQKSDFQVWQQVDDILTQTSFLTDSEFQSFIPQIEATLLQSPLMQLLNSSEIVVSYAQKGTTPFQHTINVLRQMKTNGAEPADRKSLRWLALFHDLGKIFGANGEDAYFHPYLSAFMSSEFIFKNVKDLSIVTLQQMLYVIQFHHLYEEIHYKRINYHEAVQRLKEIPVAIFFHLLCSADVASVPTHAHHAHANHQTFSRLRGDLFPTVAHALQVQTSSS